MPSRSEVVSARFIAMLLPLSSRSAPPTSQSPPPSPAVMLSLTELFRTLNVPTPIPRTPAPSESGPAWFPEMVLFSTRVTGPRPIGSTPLLSPSASVMLLEMVFVRRLRSPSAINSAPAKIEAAELFDIELCVNQVVPSLIVSSAAALPSVMSLPSKVEFSTTRSPAAAPSTAWGWTAPKRSRAASGVSESLSSCPSPRASLREVASRSASSTLLVLLTDAADEMSSPAPKMPTPPDPSATATLSLALTSERWMPSAIARMPPKSCAMFPLSVVLESASPPPSEPPIARSPPTTPAESVATLPSMLLPEMNTSPSPLLTRRAPPMSGAELPAPLPTPPALKPPTMVSVRWMSGVDPEVEVMRSPPAKLAASLPWKIEFTMRGATVPVRARAPPPLEPGSVLLRKTRSRIVVVPTSRPERTRCGAPVPSKPSSSPSPGTPSRVICTPSLRRNDMPVHSASRVMVSPSTAWSSAACRSAQSVTVSSAASAGLTGCSTGALTGSPNTPSATAKAAAIVIRRTWTRKGASSIANAPVGGAATP